METFIIGSFCGAALFCFALVLISNRQEHKRKSEEHENLLKQERNKQLYYFQLRMIYMFGDDIVSCMPEYIDMLNSDKPLEAKHWVDVDKLVNLN